MELTVEEIAIAVQAKRQSETAKNLKINQIEFDTRKIEVNCLFVPLKGNRDGHDFIGQAFENGAVVTLSDRPLTEGIPYIEVEDTLIALQRLAAYYLKKINPQVIGITGSNGKTTTKDMTASVLATGYRTYKTQGNFNNQIGLPYTILHMPQETEMLVLEMGMDHAGEIEALTKIAHPDVAAITLIGESHIEFFESRAGIAAAKMEIAQGLQKNGLLIVPNDEPLLVPLLKEVFQQVVTFGLVPEATLEGQVVSESQAQTLFQTNQFDEVTFSIPVLGTYNVKNALIALLVGQYYQLSTEQLAAGLAHFALTKNRTQWLKTPNEIAILSDVYNANPTAMRLVVDSFSNLEFEGKKIVVLGDMLELGKLSKDLHESVAPHLDPEKIDSVYLFGPEMQALYQKLQPLYGKSVHHFGCSQKDEMLSELVAVGKKGDAILFKASNGMNLNEIVEKMLEIC